MMKKLACIFFSISLSTALLPLSSCSTTKSPEREVASEDCLKKVKPEYHSYFDNVEKCIEKKQ